MSQPKFPPQSSTLSLGVWLQGTQPLGGKIPSLYKTPESPRPGSSIFLLRRASQAYRGWGGGGKDQVPVGLLCPLATLTHAKLRAKLWLGRLGLLPSPLGFIMSQNQNPLSLSVFSRGTDTGPRPSPVFVLDRLRPRL